MNRRQPIEPRRCCVGGEVMETTTRSRLIGYEAAEAFALERHGKQDHGSLKIEDHLRDVVANTRKHMDQRLNNSSRDIIAAAWLHDVVEDTDASLGEICDCFGERVAQIVGALTDKPGANRMERHLHTYHIIRDNMDAKLIKLCDRRHNHARSIAYGEHYMAMYMREFSYFKFALWQPNQFIDLWHELDSQYEQMQDKLSW